MAIGSPYKSALFPSGVYAVIKAHAFCVTFVLSALLSLHEPLRATESAESKLSQDFSICSLIVDPSHAISQTRYSLPKLVKTPLREQGQFDFSLVDISTYYASHPMTSELFKLESPPESMSELAYKMNDRGDFQMANWHETADNILDYQAAWNFQLSDFVSQYEGKDLIEAKQNFFAPIAYDPKEFHYERPYAYMREWGELPHPPIQNLDAKDIPVVNHRFTPEGPSAEAQVASAMNTAEFQKELDKRSQSELTIGNELQILMDSDSTEVKKKLIKKAKSSVFVSTLLFVNDATTMEIVDLLIEKAAQGLDVRVMAEKSLSWIHGSALRKLRKNGVQVVYANDFFKYNSSVVYHTKIVAIDNSEVVMGGQNMLDADLGAKGTNFKNRDADLYVKGPGVTDIIWNFTQDWNHFANKFKIRKWGEPFTKDQLQVYINKKAEERRQGLRGQEHYAQWFLYPAKLPKGTGRFIGQSPYNNVDTITEAHLMYLEATNKYFVLTNPHIFDTYTEDKPRGLRISHKRFKNFNRLFTLMQDKLKNQDGYEMDLLTTGGDFATNEATPMAEIMTKDWLEKGKVLPSNLLFLLIRWGNKKLFKLTYSLIQKDWLPLKNARIWAHQSYLHSKIWYFDGMAASIGSLNLHFNATDHSYEASFITHDPQVLRHSEQVLATDFANSIPFTK